MKVYLISKPEFNCSDMENFAWHEACQIPTPFERFMHDELKQCAQVSMCFDEEDGDLLAETAGRLCYMSYGRGRKSNREYIEHLLQSGHYSVLEHANYTFIITGVSRSLTHELVRHRIMSFSMLSQRYVDESETEFIIPPIIEHDQDIINYINCIYERQREDYKDLVGIIERSISNQYPELTGTDLRKAARGAARCILPNGTETKICVTANARAWRHFIEMRANPAADIEIRRLAVEIYKQLETVSPNIFNGYKIVELPDQSQAVESMYKKV